MKTIVYLISTLKRSGPTNVLAGIIKNLDTTKFKPVIITLSPEEDEKNSWWQEFQTMGISLCSLNLSRLQGLFLANKKLKQLLVKVKPDIIHAHCFRSAVLVAMYLQKYPSFATIHCDFFSDYTQRYKPILGRGMAMMYSWAMKRISYRIACSNMLADLLNRKYPHLHFDYVDNGVDTNKFHPVANKTTLRRQLNLPIDKKIIIWAGHFIPLKNPLTLVRSILQLPQYQYYFIFCGKGCLMSECISILQNHKNVLFTGYVSNIEQYYQAADIYVSTSRSEGLPLAVLEAQFCGIVPLLSDIPQHRYILPQDQLTKCLYDGQPDDLIKKLLFLLQTDNTGLMKSCAVNIQNFSAKKMSQKYQKSYDKCQR